MLLEVSGHCGKMITFSGSCTSLSFSDHLNNNNNNLTDLYDLSLHMTLYIKFHIKDPYVDHVYHSPDI